VFPRQHREHLMWVVIGVRTGGFGHESDAVRRAVAAVVATILAGNVADFNGKLPFISIC
jgi:hypothetical protein